MNRIIVKCPVCGGDLTVTRLHCANCETTIEGQFMPGGWIASPFTNLSSEQLQFLLTFLRCEGRFNRMEEETGLSYPTLRSRFNEVLRTMGFEPGKEEAPAKPSSDERRRILEELEQGRISPAEAQRRLRGKKEEAPVPPAE